MRAVIIFLLAGLVALPVIADDAVQRFPDVVGVRVTPKEALPDKTRIYDFDVTVSSPYDSAVRYADGFRVTTLSGDVLGERVLWHDHHGEQPFTRDLYGVKIPSDVKSVNVQARDKANGYGGRIVRVALPE